VRLENSGRFAPTFEEAMPFNAAIVTKKAGNNIGRGGIGTRLLEAPFIVPYTIPPPSQTEFTITIHTVTIYSKKTT